MPQADSRSTTPIPPLPKELPPATRKIVAAAIKQHMAATEALIAFLDKVDGDPDLEASLAGTYSCTLSTLDAEGDEHDGREPDEGSEPILGSPNPDCSDDHDQEHWAVGGTDDREGDQHDGREFSWNETHGLGGIGGVSSEDQKPSLAHTNDVDQTRAHRNLSMVNHGDGLWRYKEADMEAEHDGREPEDETDGLHDGELDVADHEPRCPPMMD